MQNNTNRNHYEKHMAFIACMEFHIDLCLKKSLNKLIYERMLLYTSLVENESK